MTRQPGFTAFGIILVFIGIILLFYASQTLFIVGGNYQIRALLALGGGVLYIFMGMVFIVAAKSGRGPVGALPHDIRVNRRQLSRDFDRSMPAGSVVEEPSKKVCPKCKKYIYKDARVCRFCGNGFVVTYILKVYRPKGDENYRFLVDTIAKTSGKTKDEVTALVEHGIRFKYSQKDSLLAHKAKFENLGCKTEVYEKVERE